MHVLRRVLPVALLGTPVSDPAAAEAPASSPIRFREIAGESGVHFRFQNGSRGRHDLPEVMGGGVALIDLDADGWPDIYFCNGGPIDPQESGADPPCRFYRNNGDGTFSDRTATADAPGPRYAMGVAVGDFDGDGRDDLFVTGWRDQRLYRNLDGVRFVDVTERAGVTSNRWSTSAAFADLDRDGDLDLFVTNYVDYDPAQAPYCSAPDGKRDYCGPEDFPAQPDRLYRNNGDGTFTDVSTASGVAQSDGRGLGVLIANWCGDSLLDIFVANDGSACKLYENKGGLRFEDTAVTAGVAVDGQGRPLAGMGVARGDINGDGHPDLVATNFLGRSTIAFEAQGNGSYIDASTVLGLTSTTRGVLGFGVALEDFDGDGRLDLFQANGHVLDRARLGVPFAMRPTLLRNDGRRFMDVPDQADPWFGRQMLGRGVAVGDLDRDGRPDVVINSLDAPAAILHNDSPGGHWLILELVGRSPRSAVGASVRALVDGRAIVRDLSAGGSYLSASDRRLFIGLGGSKHVKRLEVQWPSGKVEVWSDLEAGQSLKLTEGTGRSR